MSSPFIVILKIVFSLPQFILEHKIVFYSLFSELSVAEELLSVFILWISRTKSELF